jgi:RimJ/RimL family protein N-acetyltransferase
VALRTARLVLRPFRVDDAGAFERFARSDAYLRYLGDGHPDPAVFVANNLDLDGAWVIELDGVVVGYSEIVARAPADNVASVRALARLGFVASDDGSYRLGLEEYRATS